MRIKFVPNQCFQNFKEENAVISGMKLKPLNPKKESLPLTVEGTSRECNIANLWKDHFSTIANSVGSTHRVSSQQESGSEMRRFALSRNFVT